MAGLALATGLHDIERTSGPPAPPGAYDGSGAAERDASGAPALGASTSLATLALDGLRSIPGPLRLGPLDTVVGGSGPSSSTPSYVSQQSVAPETDLSSSPQSNGSDGDGADGNANDDDRADEPIASHGGIGYEQSDGFELPGPTWLWTAPLGAAIVLGTVAIAMRRGRAEAERQPARPVPPAIHPVRRVVSAPAATTGGASSDQAQAVGSVAAGKGAERPEPGVRGVMRMAGDAMASGEIQDAVRWFETAIALQPRLATAHLCLGLCLEKAGDYEQAADSFGHGLSLTPEDPALHYNLARALAKDGRTEEAMETIAPVLQVFPELFDNLRQEPAFAPLVDDPRFLQRAGLL